MVLAFVVFGVLVLCAFGAVGCKGQAQSQRVGGNTTGTPTATTTGGSAVVHLSAKLPEPVYYGLKPGDLDFHPHRQFNDNVDLAEAYRGANPRAKAFRVDGPNMTAALSGFDAVVKYRKLLRISNKTIAGMYGRLWRYYNWTSYKYDKKTEVTLQKYAKIAKVKYRKPRYW